MSDFEHDNPLSLEPSAEYLEDLKKRLAGVLIERGKIEDSIGVYATSSGETPRSFIYPLDLRFARETFFPGDEETVITRADISYNMPHELEPLDSEFHDDDWSGLASVTLELEGYFDTPSHLPKDRVEIEAIISLGWGDSRPLEGKRTLDYYRDGVRVSPNDLPLRDFGDMTDEQRAQFFADQQASTHPFTLDDTEMFEKVVDYIKRQPKID